MTNSNPLSRRGVLRDVGTVLATGALAASDLRAGSQSLANGNQTDPRIIALMGDVVPNRNGPRALALIGDRYHNWDYIRVSLDRLFKELSVPIDYTTNYEELSRDLLQRYQLFILFRDNMVWPGGYSGPNHDPHEDFLENPEDFPPEKPVEWITEEQAQAIADFVTTGNGFFSLHNSAFISRSSRKFREVLGGVDLGYPPLRPFKVHVVNKEHPLTQGIEDFMVTDEQHFLVYDKDPANILLRGQNIDGLAFDRPTFEEGAATSQSLGVASVSAWAHEYGRGRVVFSAMGHTNDAMWQPEHYKFQKNAVRWLLRTA